jgi:hypothetical protein
LNGTAGSFRRERGLPLARSSPRRQSEPIRATRSRKALDADPAFREDVARLLRDIEDKDGQPITQIARTVGDHNVTTQIAGSGNIVR